MMLNIGQDIGQERKSFSNSKSGSESGIHGYTNLLPYFVLELGSRGSFGKQRKVPGSVSTGVLGCS